jgi:amino acid transporter
MSGQTAVTGGDGFLNSAALTLSFDRTTLAETSASSDPVTPVIVNSFGAWAEKPFLAIVMVSFLACGASVVNYVSRIIYWPESEHRVSLVGV